MSISIDNMGTYRSKPRRGATHFRDYDGSLMDHKYEDEIVSFTWDLTDILNGSTVSSYTTESKAGLTISSDSNTTTSITLVITKTGGAKIVATLADGTTREQTFWWAPIDEGDTDYGNY